MNDKRQPLRVVRIAVYHNLPSGGALRALTEFASRLSQRYHLTLYTLDSAEHDFLPLDQWVDDKHLTHYRPWLPLGDKTVLAWPLAMVELLRLDAVARHIAVQIDRTGHDVAFIHHDQITQAPLLLRYLQIPSVYYCQETFRVITEPHHETDSMRDALRSLVLLTLTPWLAVLRRLEQCAILHATRVLVNSYFSLESLYRIYGIRGRVSYLGVDCHSFRPLGLEREKFVMCVGRLTRFKAQDFLIESLACLPESERPPLVLVYDKYSPAYRDYLQSLADYHGVALTLMQRISDEHLVELYNQAACTVYAPILEPFGLVPLESLACGTPVVAVCEGGVRETVIPGQGGILVERDHEAFAEAVATLLADPTHQRTLGQAGRRYVRENWSWERAVESLERHIEAVLA